MLAEGHRKKAERIERSLAKLQPDVDLDGVIEMAWGAAFQWIAFGCETRYHQHQNNHTRLGRFHNGLGERTAASWWDNLDQLRQGGWYGSEPDPAAVQEAVALLEEIRLWATHREGARQCHLKFIPSRPGWIGRRRLW